MFSLKIIDTDLFLDMPLSTQALYFHLSMRADDDGFIGNHKKIMRMIGAADDDMRILIAKQLLIPFDSGVCVIKHWRIHNYIRSDRYTPTFYKTEKALLVENTNVYDLDTKGNQNVIPNVIPNDNHLGDEQYPQVRLGKVRLGKVSKDIHTYNNTNNIVDIETVDEKEKEDKYVNKSNSNIKEFSRLYENNIGLINGISAEYIKELSEKIEVDLFKQAIEIANNRGKLNLGYIKGIINQWLSKNITTCDQYKASELERKKERAIKTGKPAVKKTKFHNFKENFTQYSPDELDEIIRKSQREKFK